MPDVTTTSPDDDVGDFRHVVHAQRVALADDHALRARSLDERARGRVAVDDELHLRGPRARHDDAADDAGRRDDRHVGPQTVALALVDRHGAEVRRRGRADDLGGGRRHRQVVAQLEQFLQAARPVRQRPLLLPVDLRRGELTLQRIVLGLDVAEVHVAAPRGANARDARRHAALHLREDPERDLLEDRHARPRVHLGGDEQDVSQNHREEQVAGTLMDVGQRHV